MLRLGITAEFVCLSAGASWRIHTALFESRKAYGEQVSMVSNSSADAGVAHGPIVALVSCVKKKGETAVPARDLYVSQLFRGLLRYAERHADAWFILSAEHGLVRPDQIVAPYELLMSARIALGLLDQFGLRAETMIPLDTRHHPNLAARRERMAAVDAQAGFNSDEHS